MSNIARVRRRKLSFFLLTIAGLLLLLFLIKNLLVSSLLAFVGFYLLSPLVDLIERRGLSRRAAVTIPFIGVSLLLYLLVLWAGPPLVQQFQSLKTDLPRYIEVIQKLGGQLQSRLADFVPADTATDVARGAEEHMMSWLRNFFSDLPEHISNSLTVLFLAPFLCFFMLVDGRDWVRHLVAIVPNQFFELTLNLQHEISHQMGGFIRARLLESLIVTALTAIGLFAIGFRYALVLSVLSGVLNLIPYVGPIFGALPALLIATMNGGHSSDYVSLIIVFGVAQMVDAAFILPVLVAKIVNLHPVWVVLSIIIGSQLMGILGMIISIPVASALKVTVSALYQHLTQFRDGP